MDAHAVVKDLIAAGFTDQQAEAATRVVREAQEKQFGEIATKADLKLLESDLKADMAGLKVNMADFKAEILKWMMTAIGLQTVVIIGAVLALVRPVAR